MRLQRCFIFKQKQRKDHAKSLDWRSMNKSHNTTEVKRDASCSHEYVYLTLSSHHESY